MTYTRSPEARQRDALAAQVEAVRAELDQTMNRLREAETQRREAEKATSEARKQAAEEAQKQAAEIRMKARTESERILAEAGKQATQVRERLAKEVTAAIDANQEAKRVLTEARRNATRMRTAAQKHIDRRANERPRTTLLDDLMDEMYGPLAKVRHMNGLPVAFYTYQGTQTGDLDPWQKPKPPPKPAPKPRLPRSTKNNPQPCGTYPKYGWHRRRGQHCEPCWEAKRAYDKQRRGPQRVTTEARAKKREYDRERYKRLKREWKR